MKYRKLGNTGLEVSEVGFGCWGIGGLSRGATSYGETDDAESLRALRRAYECGITFYDTSDLYGYGHSEELLGEAFHAMRDQVVIASKVGFLEHKGPQDFSPAHLRRSLETSLKRLRTDYLDLYQLHSPPIETVSERPEVVATLKDLQREGKIRAYGISVQKPEDGLTAVKLGFSALQVNFNLLDQRARQNGLMETARKMQAGIIARTPLAFGFLTGKLGTKFDPRDHRSTWSAEQLHRWAEAPSLFAFINRNKNCTPAQLALRFCLDFPAVATVIPGILHPEEAEEDARASELPPLTSEEREAIDMISREHVFFLGKND